MMNSPDFFCFKVVLLFMKEKDLKNANIRRIRKDKKEEGKNGR